MVGSLVGEMVRMMVVLAMEGEEKKKKKRERGVVEEVGEVGLEMR